MKQLYLLTSVLLGAHLSFAQEKKDTSTVLEEVVVTSPFTPPAQSPVTMSQLSRKELERKNYGQEPSVFVPGYQLPLCAGWYATLGGGAECVE